MSEVSPKAISWRKDGFQPCTNRWLPTLLSTVGISHSASSSDPESAREFSRVLATEAWTVFSNEAHDALPDQTMLLPEALPSSWTSLAVGMLGQMMNLPDTLASSCTRVGASNSFAVGLLGHTMHLPDALAASCTRVAVSNSWASMLIDMATIQRKEAARILGLLEAADWMV